MTITDSSAISRETQKHLEIEQYMPVVSWMATHFSRPFSPVAVAGNLPDGFERDDKGVLLRALGVIGLKSSFVQRDIHHLDPAVLPSVLFRKEGTPVILTGFTKKRKYATILDPVRDNLVQEIDTRELHRQLDPEILLVTTQSDVANSRLSPETRSMSAQQGHWLLEPIREHWNSWLQVLIAALAINLFGLALPIFVMNVYDRVIPNLAFVTLWTLAGGVLIALIFDLVMKVIRANVIEQTSRRIDLQIAAKLFRQAMNVKLLSRPGGAAGMANHIRDFETVREFFTSSSFIAIIDVLFIGIFIAVLWSIVGSIAIVPLLAVPIVVILALIAQIPIGNSVALAQQMATKRHIVLVESLQGIETIKSLNGEPVMQREWENAVAASVRINGKTRFWSNFAINGTMLVQQAVSVVIIVWGVFLVSEGTISIGGLIAANILAGRVLAPLGNISQTLIRSHHAFKSMAALSELMKLPVDDGEGVRSGLRINEGSLSVQDVSFTYPGAPMAALGDISFTFQPGETIALLGRVGSGKTTLGKLLIGLIEPQKGLILVDGQEVNQFERTELREGIGYLPQDPELFTGTIRENLLLGRSDASEEELNRALYFSGMDYFIAQNPEGLNQFVGEKGNRLSGGQRQAIALARLLIRRPRLLFLDEPTNAMDNQTEATVINRLAELNREGVGMILSTHRHSLAAIVDRMIVLDKGRKILDGPREEVLSALKQKRPPETENSE